MVAKLREAGAIVMGKANLAEFATDGHFSPERVRPGVERVRPVEVADRLLRRLGRRRWRRRFAAAALRHADRRLAVGPVERRLARLAARHGRHAVDRRRDAADLRAGLRGLISRSRCRTSRCCSTRPRSTARPTRSTTSPTATARRTGPPALDDERAAGQGHRRARDRRSTIRSARRAPSDAMRASVRALRRRRARRSRRSPDPPAGPASPPGDRGYEGWRQWMLAHPDTPYTDVVQIMRSPLRLPQFRNTNPYTGTGAMTPEQVAGFQAAARELPRAAGGLDGRAGRRRRRLPGPALATSTSTTRSSRASAAATRRPRRRACRT